MEQTPNEQPLQSDARQEAAERTPITKKQKLLLLGALAIGIAFQLLVGQDNGNSWWFFVWYPVFWMTALAVFLLFYGRRVLASKTAVALAIPAVALNVVFMLDYLPEGIAGWIAPAIPALLITLGVFSRQEIPKKREGIAVLGVLQALFVKPFSGIGAFFRSIGSLFRKKGNATTRRVLLGLLIGLPLFLIVLALLADADAGMDALLVHFLDDFSVWTWFWRIVRVLIVAMLFYSLFYQLIWGKRDPLPAPVKQSWKLAMPATVIALQLAAYAVFTGVQFGYLFGGTLPVDLTYSEYARAGFGEFVLVTVINFTVLGVSLVKTERSRAIRVLQTLLIAASLIVLASAAWRMLLYVVVYGLTVNRILPLWLMAYLAFLAAVGVVRVYRETTPYLRIGAFGLVYWFLLLTLVDWTRLIDVYNLAHGFGG